MSTEENFKIVVLGGGGVGKSALTIRLVTDNFLEEYDPTIEDSYRKNAVVDDIPVSLDILDTAGQEEYSSMQDQWMREGKGFLLVYSITEMPTFDEMVSFREKILRASESDMVPIVLVGNKCDMESQRQVTYEAGQKLAELWHCPFMETSAKTKIKNVDCFHQLVREIRESESRIPDSIDKASGSGGGKCCILL